METLPRRAFVVATPSDVRDALARANGEGCTLLSAEAAAASLGCLGFLTLVEEGMRDASDVPVAPDAPVAEILALLDCTGAPGRAAEAIAFFAPVARVAREAPACPAAPAVRVFGVVLAELGAAEAELVACASEADIPAFTERPPLEPLSPEAV